MKYKLKRLLVLTPLILLFPTTAYAADWGSCIVNDIPTLQCLPVALSNLVSAAFALSGITTAILIILSGIKLVTSGGDMIKIEKAKKSLTYSIVGFVIILLSYTILRVVSTVTGASCITILGYNSCG